MLFTYKRTFKRRKMKSRQKGALATELQRIANLYASSQYRKFCLYKLRKWSRIMRFVSFINNQPLMERGRKLTHQSTFEVVWTVLPALILILLAIPSLKLLYSLDFLIFEYEPIITVKVIGHQWYW